MGDAKVIFLNFSTLVEHLTGEFLISCVLVYQLKDNLTTCHIISSRHLAEHWRWRIFVEILLSKLTAVTYRDYLK